MFMKEERFYCMFEDLNIAITPPYTVHFTPLLNYWHCQMIMKCNYIANADNINHGNFLERVRIETAIFTVYLLVVGVASGSFFGSYI